MFRHCCTRQQSRNWREVSVPRRGWLYRQKRRYLGGLGWYLVALGRWLQRLGQALNPAIEERVIMERNVGS
jgi:hypothetical protein